ncbi:MAG: PhnD/SsuA/transferrin family substrate-binding protein [Caldilineaceae bacterium]
MDPVCQAITTYIGERLPHAVQTQFVDDIRWQERFRQLDADQIQVAWICGSHYVRRFDQTAANLELLAAPVWRAERYQGKPVYYSDVVVHKDSPFHTFADLRGATWAYNEPGSLSGYEIMRYHLATLGENLRFFGRIVESGAHLASLRMLVARQVDVSAIDSTVLEQKLRTEPALAAQLRVLDVLGPSPMPPWVVTQTVPDKLRTAIRSLLTTMHENPVGQNILAQGAISHFAPVVDADYDPVRRMLAAAAH